MVAVPVFDRVLDRHDVRGARRVDVVDHCGERRRIAAAGRTGHEDKAALLGRDLWSRAYAAALAEGYRFLSYGDSSLLVRPIDPSTD